MPRCSYALSATSICLGAVVRVDGMTVFSSVDHRPQVANLLIDPYLVEGSHRVEVCVFPVSIPEDVSDEPHVEVIILRPERLHEPTEADYIVSCAYVHGVHKLVDGAPRGAMTTLLDHMFRVPEKFGPWAWERAQRYDANGRVEVLALVQRLGEALRARDLRTVSELLAMRFTEVALGLEKPREDVEGGFFEYMGMVMADDGFEVDVIQPSDMTLVTTHEGRLVTVTDPMGKPPVVVRSAEHCLPFGVTASRIEGKMAIVR